MIQILFFAIFNFIFLSSCLQMPPRYNSSALDECNFSVSPFGIGHRWSRLPVELTFHSRFYHEDAQHTTMKVINEWNQIWRVAGQDKDLFRVLGSVDYESAKQVEDDNLNSLTIIDSYQNRNCDGNQGARCFLKSVQQGVTSIKGRGFSDVAEADVFINTDDYEYYFKDGGDGLNLASQTHRGLASYGAPVSFIKKFWQAILDFFFAAITVEREPASERGSIPRHMVDFESLISHELGHVLALGHNNTNGSIMKNSLGLGVKRRGLRRIELDSLLCGYGK